MSITGQHQALIIDDENWSGQEQNSDSNRRHGITQDPAATRRSMEERTMKQGNIPASVVNFDIEVAKTLFPLNSMLDSHLAELIKNSKVDVIFRGQTLFEEGAYDKQTIFLLHGDIELINSKGEKKLAKASQNLLPIATGQPRAYRAVATTDCCVLRIDSEYLDKMLTWSQIAEYLMLDISYQRDLDDDVEWMMTVLKSNLFFKVPPTNTSLIFSKLETLHVKAGDPILRQGEIGNGCYFIKQGEAEVRQSPDGNKPPAKVADIGPGRCFGEDALVNETVRNATVVMKTDGILMMLSKRNFLKLLKEPKVETVDTQTMHQKVAEGSVCIDVRTEEEYASGHIDRAINIPLNLLRIKTRLLNRNTHYIIYCDTGRRSRAAAHLLSKGEFNVTMLAGGMRSVNKAAGSNVVIVSSDYFLRGGNVTVGK